VASGPIQSFKREGSRNGLRIKKPRVRCLGLLCSICGGMVKRGAHDIKNPLPVISFRKGLQQTRRLDTHPHGAHTSEAAYPWQSSSCKGCCSMNIPALHRGSSHLRILIECPPCPTCQEDEPARPRALRCWAPCRRSAISLTWWSSSPAERQKRRGGAADARRWIRAFSPPGPAALWGPG
jgi:hypothetical protein